MLYNELYDFIPYKYTNNERKWGYFSILYITIYTIITTNANSV